MDVVADSLRFAVVVRHCQDLLQASWYQKNKNAVFSHFHSAPLLVFLFPFSFSSVLNSKLPYDVTPEQAMSHEEVRTRLEASIKNMRMVTDKFLSAIVVSVDKIP